MRMYDIIDKKKRGGALSSDEIDFFVSGVTDGSIPDYQTSALLMAICINGMNEEETVMLTEAMRDSGDVADMSCFGGVTADKHSTGGVGDKTSLIVMPIVASLGCIAAKMSGRGLGHTGGTVDKLESIPGYRTELSGEEFRCLAKENGIVLVGQSDNFAPADKKLYALRDVTATVDCIPLIASSIMSKKLAAGTDVIVLDVKTGSGAFMKDYDGAKQLADCMVSIGNRCGKKCAAIISDMSVPLGRAIGNALEVKEAIRLLRGGSKGQDLSDIADLRENCLELATKIVLLCFNYNEEKAREMCDEALVSGAAFDTFCKWIKSQGGDLSFLESDEAFENFGKAEFLYCYRAKRNGTISSMDTERIGFAAACLGAGRRKKADIIDTSAGLVLSKKTGDSVTEGDVIAVLYSSVQKDFGEAEKLLDSAVNID